MALQIMINSKPFSTDFTRYHALIKGSWYGYSNHDQFRTIFSQTSQDFLPYLNVHDMPPQIMNIPIYFPQTSQDFLHYLKVHDMFFQIMINSELFPANFTRINKFFLSLNENLESKSDAPI